MAGVFVVLYLFMHLAIVLGYYNTHFGLDTLPVQLVYEHLPVFTTAALLTLLQPANLLFAAYHSRGDHRAYRNSLLVGNWLGPMLLVVLALPGETATPENLGNNLIIMLVFATVAHFCACAWVQEDVWRRLGAKDAAVSIQD